MLTTLVASLALALGSPIPTPSTAAEAELVRHVPQDLLTQATCDFTAPQVGADAAITCTRSGNAIPNYVDYEQFPSAQAMDTFVKYMTRGFPVEHNSCTSVSDLSGGGGQQNWPAQGTPRGTALCYRNEDQDAVVLWTDRTHNIAVAATETHDVDFQGFLDWFEHGAGPV